MTSPEGDCLPTIADECALAKDSTLCKSCPSDDNCLNSDASEGTTLPSSWSDACCADEGLTILARIGSKLSRFAGTGFIAIESGVAKIVPSVPIQLTTLWHRWWKPTPASAPILGEPLAYPYQTIADTSGVLHAIKGPADEDATPVWDAVAKEYTQMPLSEVPLDRKGVITSQDDIELVGYEPIPVGGDPDTVRPMRALSGAGLVVLTEQATLDDTCDCAPGTGTVSLAQTLPLPSGGEVYTLKFSNAQGGLYWSEDA